VGQFGVRDQPGASHGNTARLLRRAYPRERGWINLSDLEQTAGTIGIAHAGLSGCDAGRHCIGPSRAKLAGEGFRSLATRFDIRSIQGKP
jgi:hypothetical protein